jgi:hypothetical protein
MAGFDMQKAMKASSDALEAYMVNLAGSKRIAEAHAKYIRALYEGLIRVGFSADEAVRIASGAPLPGTR